MLNKVRKGEGELGEGGDTERRRGGGSGGGGGVESEGREWDSHGEQRKGQGKE